MRSLGPSLVAVGAILGGPEAAAQAGGGGAFGTGGGGGGDGGDGLGGLIWLLLRLCIEAPAIGIPLTILVLGALAYGSRKGWIGRQSRTIRRHQRARLTHKSHQAAAELRRTDPSFDEAQFLGRFTPAFRKVQEAWCQQDLESIRHFVSDGILERFALQVVEQKEQGWRQGMANLRVGTPTLVHVDTDRHFDTVTVRVPFAADIHRVSLEKGEKIVGSTLPVSQLVECWSFLRRRGTRTPSGKGLLEGHCPNCAAPLVLNQAARCSSCESFVKSGQFDWVLAEITQESVWRDEDSDAVAGLAQYQERDPDMNAQHLEDRVSVIFWRKVAADRQGGAAPLAKVATAEFREAYGRRLRRPEQGARPYLGDVAVGSVKTLAILPGESRDRVVVEVRYDGRWFQVDAAGQRSDRPGRQMRRAFLVLVRNAGVRTDIDHAIHSGHCPSCGAADSGGLESSCAYCGVPLADGSRDWVLNELHHASEPSGRALLAELGAATGTGVVLPNAPSRSDTLQWALQAALADGEVDAAERAALERMARRLFLAPGRIDDMLGALKNGTAEAPEPRNAGEARQWFAVMLEAAMADGRVSRGEHQLLKRMAQAAGYSSHDWTRLVRETRGRLYRESREARRG